MTTSSGVEIVELRRQLEALDVGRGQEALLRDLVPLRGSWARLLRQGGRSIFAGAAPPHPPTITTATNAKTADR